MHPTALRFAERARAAGLEVDVLELSESSRTAEEAAAAAGCQLGQIVKSVVVVDGNGPLLCLTAGDRRVRLDALDARMARGQEVRDATGYAIGGVPPLGHERPLRTVVDGSLHRFATVWCAAGTPHAIFATGLADLLAAIPNHRVADVTE